jgi:hypothetical protein
MGKSIRQIKVKGQSYCWAIAAKRRPDHIRVGVWGANQKGQKLNVKVRFDDPWINFSEMITSRVSEKSNGTFETRPITPSVMREIILAALKDGWNPDQKGSELYFEWNRYDGELTPMSGQEYKANSIHNVKVKG